MIVEFEIDGRRRTVGVRRHGNGWVVELDGRRVSATLVEVDGRWSLLMGRPDDALPGGAPGLGEAFRSYEIAFDEMAGGGREYLVHVNGERVPLSVIDPRRSARRSRSDGGASDTGRRTITAPMPGRIVKVLVTPGEAVAARQGLIVIEAMKMENELRAPRPGTVAEVRVSEGSSVDANAVLVVLE